MYFLPRSVLKTIDRKEYTLTAEFSEIRHYYFFLLLVHSDYLSRFLSIFFTALRRLAHLSECSKVKTWTMIVICCPASLR